MDSFETGRNGTGESCMIDKKQVSQRKYTPELRSIPLTFLDCLDRTPSCCVDGIAYCAQHKYPGTQPRCEDIVSGNIQINIYGLPYFVCPMGYVR